MYYIQQNNTIVLFDESLERIQNTLLFTPQYAGSSILETKREIIELNNEFVFKDEAGVELAQTRKEEFLKQFFKIDGFGYYRKQPKGYGSAVESLNTAYNIVSVIGKLPENTLTFYTEPDFTKEEQCTEEWLVANSMKSSEMTTADFGTFYAQFMTAWNMQEHQQ